MKKKNMKVKRIAPSFNLHRKYSNPATWQPVHDAVEKVIARHAIFQRVEELQRKADKLRQDEADGKSAPECVDAAKNRKVIVLGGGERVLSQQLFLSGRSKRKCIVVKNKVVTS